MASRSLRACASWASVLALAGCSGARHVGPAVTVPAVQAPPAVAVTLAAATSGPGDFSPASITLVLEDARLADVRGALEHEEYAKGAKSLEAALANAARPPSAEERAEWLYQLGRLRALAGDPGGAARAFQESARMPWTLAAYASLQAAQWFVGVGDHTAALKELAAIPPGLPIAAAVELASADARLGKGDFDGAAPLFRAYLARDPKPPPWVNVALRFAAALLAHPTEEHAEEAVTLVRHVLFESPGGAGAGTAKDLEAKALATMPHARRAVFEQPSADDLLGREKALVTSQQYREAVAVSERLLPLAQKPGAFACEVTLARADALAKLRKKPEAADAYEDAIARCEGQPRRVDALFGGGRASAKAGRQVEAMARYALVEKEFPAHSLADDARYQGARAALDANDGERFTSMLATMADAYPAGDRTTDGLFELALHHVERGDWAGAIAPLERALLLSPHEHAYHSAGRLPYFLARAHLETGATARGLAELAAVIKAYPLSYYMALAYARLSERDPQAAERAVAEAFALEPKGELTVPRGPWLQDASFVRAVELLRQGDTKLARGELDRLGVGARTAPNGVLWTAVFLFARAGAIGQAHGLLRAGMAANAQPATELVDWLDHYPAGRWRSAWEIAYPRPFAGLVTAEAKREALPEAWAYAIMREESAFEPHASSPAKAFGLMQLVVPTAKHMAEPLGLPWDEEALKRPEVNIALGCRYLSVLRSEFADNPLLAIPSYNAGSGASKKWLKQRPADDFDVWVERIPYEETRLYTKRVLTSLAGYEFLYARDQPSEALRTPLPASPSSKAAIATAAN